MAFEVRAEEGFENDIVRQLGELSKEIRTKVTKKAITKGAQALVKRAKALVPIRDVFSRDGKPLKGALLKRAKKKGRFVYAKVKKDETVSATYKGGLLKKSLGYKVKVYPSGVAVAICGPRNGFRQQVGVTIRKRKNTPAGRPVYADPAKYAHLVELGTRHSSPKPFLRPAGIEGAKVTAKTLADEVAKAIADTIKDK